VIIDRLKALGYSMNEIIDILIMTESKKSNLLKLIELLELKEELKNKEDGK